MGKSTRIRVFMTALACAMAVPLFSAFAQPAQEAGRATDNARFCFGEKHAAMVKADGTVWTWGQNDMGQLGTGNNAPSAAPVQVANLGGVVAVACGGNHTLALKSDGKVVAWGLNLYGQLGNGGKVNTPYPVEVLNLADVARIAAGSTHSVALLKSGLLMAWGGNIYGQVGDGSKKPALLAVRVFGDLRGIVSISAVGDHTVAQAADGTVWSWGLNKSGQLGTGQKSDVSLPVQAVGLFGVKSAKAGGQYSMALKEDGTIWSWGMDNAGQLGYGSGGGMFGSGVALAAPAVYLQDVTAIYPCGSHSFAVRKDGTVWSWGNNSSGQLCNGSTTNTPWPLQVGSANNVQSIVCSDSQTVIFRNDGSMWGCGGNSDGRLGDRLKGGSAVPVKLSFE